MSADCLYLAQPLIFLADFRSKFSAIHREYSPLPRKFYGFCTTVTVRSFVSVLFMVPEFSSMMQDTTTTAGILASGKSSVVLPIMYTDIMIVRDMVVRRHLKQSRLL